MIRLIGSFLIVAIIAGGSLYVDFRMSARWAGRSDGDGLTFREYLSDLSGRIAGLSSASAASGLPTELADMLPRAPEGWTVRPIGEKDVTPFLPKASAKADKKAVGALEAFAEASGDDGTEVAAFAYEKGGRTVLIRAIRYPNGIFTGNAAPEQLLSLQQLSAEFRGTEFATVRGLDLTEDLLPEGFRGRLFLADVGAQIHVRILAPKRMKDTELLPFLETLNVEAMNASVIDKVDGLGKAPVIVLASALADADRDAYRTEVAARRTAIAEREAIGRDAAEAAVAKPSAGTGGGGLLSQLFGSSDTKATAPVDPVTAPKTVSCGTGTDGVKRCKVETPTPAE